MLPISQIQVGCLAPTPSIARHPNLFLDFPLLARSLVHLIHLIHLILLLARSLTILLSILASCTRYLISFPIYWISSFYPDQVGPGGAIGFTQRLESTKAKIDFYRSSKFRQSVKSLS